MRWSRPSLTIDCFSAAVFIIKPDDLEIFLFTNKVRAIIFRMGFLARIYGSSIPQARIKTGVEGRYAKRKRNPSRIPQTPLTTTASAFAIEIDKARAWEFKDHNLISLGDKYMVFMAGCSKTVFPAVGREMTVILWPRSISRKEISDKTRGGPPSDTANEFTINNIFIRKEV
jgi:hypothetical protein